MALKTVLIIIIVLVVIFIILPFVLNMVGIPIFQFGSVGGGSSRSAGEGLLISEDGGETWANAGFSEERRDAFPKEIFGLTFHPEDPNVIFLASKSSGIWRSDTRGKSWKKMIDESGTLDPRADIYKVSPSASNPKVIYALIFQNNRGRVIKSENNGKNFKEIYSETADKIGIFDIYVSPSSDSHVVIVTGRGAVLESRDGGESWRVKKWFTDPLVKLLVNPRNSAEIMVVTSRGVIFRSLDGGENWLEIKESVEGTPGGKTAPVFSYPPRESFSFFGSRAGSVSKILTVDPNNPSIIYTVPSNGLLKSTNSGTSWRKIQLLLPQTSSINSLAIHPRDSQTVFVATGAQLHVSRDGGANWSIDILPTKSSVKTLYIHPLMPEVMFAVLGR